MFKKNLFWVIAIFILLFPLLARAEGVNIFKFGDDIVVEEGMRVNNIIAVGGQVTLYGVADGTVVSIGDSVVLGPYSIVGGNVMSIGGVIVRGKGSEVNGSLTEINSSNVSQGLATVINSDWVGWSWFFAIISITFYLGLLILAILLVLLIPKPIRVISDAVERKPYKAGFWGLIGLILVVPLAFLLTISVIGVVLVPLEISIAIAGMLIGFVAVSRLVGRRIFVILKKPDQTYLRETVWGMTFLWFAGWIPYVGWMLKVFVVLLGLGGVLVTRFGTYRKPMKSIEVE
ncbi:MAG: hypothetical protein JW902_04710 [Syntrophaceae bacterium]|nr:hypothetical protein [Syntrophaceae bacterium]